MSGPAEGQKPKRDPQPQHRNNREHHQPDDFDHEPLGGCTSEGERHIEQSSCYQADAVDKEFSPRSPCSCERKKQYGEYHTKYELK